jgi:hypothetical protein
MLCFLHENTIILPTLNFKILSLAFRYKVMAAGYTMELLLPGSAEGVRLSVTGDEEEMTLIQTL